MASNNHNRYIVGLFEEPAEAQTVARELRNIGLDGGDIHTVNRGESRGLAGTLKKHGVPEKHTHYYAEGVRRGGTLVTVNSDDRHSAAAIELMHRHGAVDINRLASYYRSGGFDRHDETQTAYDERQTTEDRQRYRDFDYDKHRTSGETVLPEVEEQIEIGKQRVQTGGVRVFTRETQQPVEQDVTLREEHVDVDRKKVDRPASNEDLAAFREGDVTISESAERPVVNKKQVVTEEVRVGKHAEERVERVKDTARKQEVEVERQEAAGTGRR